MNYVLFCSFVNSTLKKQICVALPRRCNIWFWSTPQTRWTPTKNWIWRQATACPSLCRQSCRFVGWSSCFTRWQCASNSKIRDRTCKCCFLLKLEQSPLRGLRTTLHWSMARAATMSRGEFMWIQNLLTVQVGSGTTGPTRPRQLILRFTVPFIYKSSSVLRKWQSQQ